MFHSLRIRLLLSMVVIGLIAIGTVAVLSSQTTTSQFQEYVQRDEQTYETFIQPLIINRIQAYIRQTYTLSESPDTPENCNENPIACDEQNITRFQDIVYQMSRIADTRIVVTTQNGIVIGDSGSRLTGKQIPPDIEGPAGVVVVQATPYLVYIDPLNEGIGSEERAFIREVNRSLIFAGGIAAIVALLLGFAISTSIIRPITTLNQAVHDLTSGDLGQQVQIRSKDEIGELAEAFNHMAATLAHLEHLRRNMVTDVAHELRTPLSNIRGYLEAVQDRVIEPTPELIASLYEEALLLNRLIDDLQELALAEAGQLRLELNQVDPETLITNLTNTMQQKAAPKDITITYTPTPPLPSIYADQDRINQILANLLSNAIAHTPDGGEIDITVRSKNDHLQILVSDNGIGIAPEEIPYIFERFYRTDRSRSRSTGGAGLGLAIVKQLVEAHHGNISVESQLDQGTTFKLTLPLYNSDNYQEST